MYKVERAFNGVFPQIINADFVELDTGTSSFGTSSFHANSFGWKRDPQILNLRSRIELDVIFEITELNADLHPGLHIGMTWNPNEYPGIAFAGIHNQEEVDNFRLQLENQSGEIITTDTSEPYTKDKKYRVNVIWTSDFDIAVNLFDGTNFDNSLGTVNSVYTTPAFNSGSAEFSPTIHAVIDNNGAVQNVLRVYEWRVIVS